MAQTTDLDRFFTPSSVAIVGASAREASVGYAVLRNLLYGEIHRGEDRARGFPGPVYPVNPKGGEILGQKVFRNVRDVPAPIDLVNVFRRSEFLPGVFDDVIASGAGAAWTQLQCIDQDGARRAERAGLTVVMNRCLMVEHGRLMGRNWTRD